jgi:hypothetical protein
LSCRLPRYDDITRSATAGGPSIERVQCTRGALARLQRRVPHRCLRRVAEWTSAREQFLRRCINVARGIER